MSGVVVGNPGSLPWLGPLAAGLERAGLLRELVVPIHESAGIRSPLVRLLPPPLGRTVRRELARRRLPDGVPTAKVRTEATLTELLSVAVRRGRAGDKLADAALRLHGRHFDSRLARRVRPGDVGVVAAWGSALGTLERARELGVSSYLDYPIAHHAFAAALLEEEARLVPAFAPTLQFHDLPESQRLRLDAEIAAADQVIVLSTFQQRTFVESGVDPQRLLLAPLGVDLELFTPQPRIAKSGFRVLFVGQIGQRKGISYLLDAFRASGIPDAELVLAGNIVGTDAPWRGNPGVHHVPHRPRWELPELYASADVFVLASLVEGFPQTALEAMACGRPTIVSENTFGDDVVTDGVDGFVVPIRDAGAIAERLRLLADDPVLRADMGAAARRRAEDFSWLRYGDRVAQAIAQGRTAG
jgi:glycosyltransferase involved in cell wall biosynthesis